MHAKSYTPVAEAETRLVARGRIGAIASLRTTHRVNQLGQWTVVRSPYGSDRTEVA
jgi:hypothetical protein